MNLIINCEQTAEKVTSTPKTDERRPGYSPPPHIKAYWLSLPRPKPRYSPPQADRPEAHKTHDRPQVQKSESFDDKLFKTPRHYEPAVRGGRKAHSHHARRRYHSANEAHKGAGWSTEMGHTDSPGSYPSKASPTPGSYPCVSSPSPGSYPSRSLHSPGSYHSNSSPTPYSSPMQHMELPSVPPPRMDFSSECGSYSLSQQSGVYTHEQCTASSGSSQRAETCVSSPPSRDYESKVNTLSPSALKYSYL